MSHRHDSRPVRHHPTQDMHLDPDGVLRFRENKIVRFLLDAGPYDMNRLYLMNFSQEDREQFAQLIGYSLSGYSELDYVCDDSYQSAARKAKKVVS